MLQIALLLAEENDVYEDIASKFFDHFVTIRDFLNEDSRSGLWHQEDRFYYDFVLREDDEDIPLRVRSLVGLLPLIAVDVIAREKLDSVPSFKARLEQRMRRRQGHLGDPSLEEREGKVLLSLAPPERVRAMLESLLDEEEFLSPFGIRSLSKKHEKEPFRLEYQGETFEVAYEPGESRGAMMGGNSNWRGPVWFPMNYLLINALRCYHSYHGDSLRVPLPSRGGSELNLEQVALELQRRLVDLLRPGKDGRVPAMPELSGLEPRELWSESLLFHEHFHGDDGRGLGSCHQTGWTALIAHCLEDLGRAGHRDLPGPGLSQGVLKKGLSDLSDLSTHIW